MRKPLALSAAVVLSAAGFAGASIIGGGGLAALAGAWTRTTATGRFHTRTYPSTEMTTTASSGWRRIEICRRRGWAHHFRFGVMIVSQRSLAAHLRHGDRIGPCAPAPHHVRGGGAGGQQGQGGPGAGDDNTGGDDDATGLQGAGGGRFGNGGGSTFSGTTTGSSGFQGTGSPGGPGSPGSNGQGSGSGFTGSNSQGGAGSDDNASDGGGDGSQRHHGGGSGH